MEFEKIKSVFNNKKLQHGISFEAKNEQISASRSILQGRNCVRFLPTGFGKTLCFVVSAVVMDNPSITHISPLLSLMDNQMDILSKWKFRCARIGKETSLEERDGIASGKNSFVFASPESVLKPRWRTIFLNEVWQQRLTCIVFDEAHCISEWGEDFRPDYKNMAELRSFYKSPVLALTATSTVVIKNDIMSVLQLNDSDTDFIARSANRPNIFLECKKRTFPEYDEELKWLIDNYKHEGRKAKKIIIYHRSIDTVSEIFISLKQSLGKHAYIDQLEKSSNLMIEMFHKCTHDSSKKRILNEFCKSDSSIRCVVATVALGMGLDVKDVDMTIHIGCPKSVISYWQEAGRCARDGRQGLSLILYDNFTASIKSTDPSMCKIVKNPENNCLRQMIIDHFTVSGKDNFKHNTCKGCKTSPCRCENCTCCSVCSRKCPCAEGGVMYTRAFLKQK